MGCDSERLGVSDGERPGQGEAVGGEAMIVRGSSFWHATRGSTASELNAHDQIEIGIGRARWTVAPVTGERAGLPVESVSPRVSGFLQRVIAEKERVARRYRAHTPLAKPVPKQVPRPARAPVPCPLCRPGADAAFPGEAWPDCEVCDGEGVVNAERAAAWHEEHR